MYSLLMDTLRLVKLFHDIGIDADALAGITEIAEDSYYELILNGLEHAAESYTREELGENVCCGGHVLHHFSDPTLLEYYRLCRLYEYKHGISPEENPYMKRADDYYTECYRNTNEQFYTGFDNETHPKEILVEVCPEWYVFEREIIELVHDMMDFYQTELEVLRAELLRGPIVWLPALPAHRKRIKRTGTGRTSKAADLKKVS